MARLKNRSRPRTSLDPSGPDHAFGLVQALKKLTILGAEQFRFRFVLVAKVKQKLTASNSCGKIGALSVDGLRVRLRGFRKSHHFIPASPDPDAGWTIRELQSAATRARVGVPRAYQPSGVDLTFAARVVASS